LFHLKDSGKSSATIARHLSSIRLFHKFLIRENIVEHDASLHIESPKKERKLPNVLSSEEGDRLLKINIETTVDVRNKSMYELIDATGLRVSELISLEVRDLHLMMGFVRCMGKGSNERIVPLGDVAKGALEDYIHHSRSIL